MSVYSVPSSIRCTQRKHVKEKGSLFCDCGALMIAPTAAKNALVVTVLDSLQRATLDKIEAAAR